jgi:DNA-binding NtrC family response regulator
MNESLISRVLVVDPQESILDLCAHTLNKLPETEVYSERNSREAIYRLQKENVDLLVVDTQFSSDQTRELFRIAREKDPNIPILLLTDTVNVKAAIDCMKLGSADYITKPFFPDDFLSTVRHLLEAKRLREEYKSLQWQMVRSHSLDGIVGRSSSMRGVFKTIQMVSQNDLDVLIFGETGTGKELVARSIHDRSHRRENRFVAIDCGAIPENLLESELFGYEKGAFTGAENRSIGLLELANKGTFFMDEVGELPIRLQAKLLRALQERKIRRVGGKEEINLDVRVIVATSRNLEMEIREQRFRNDLYYRINVARISLPSLRERTEDIPLLVSHFVTMYGEQMGKGLVEIEPEVTEILMRYSWPGNVRELQNVIKRALAMSAHHLLTVDDLPDEIVVQGGERRARDRGGFFAVRAQRIAAFEKWYLSNLLRVCLGDISRAARKAEIPRGTLYRLMKKHNLKAEDFRQ